MRSRRITSPAAPITALLIAAGLAVGVGGPAGASAATTTLGGFTITSLAEGDLRDAGGVDELVTAVVAEGAEPSVAVTLASEEGQALPER